MCTVSFVPTADGYLLCCSRDERRARGVAEGPRVEGVGPRRLFAPRDPDGGGSWIAARADGVSFCLLNGTRGGGDPWRDDAPSRGRLVLDLARGVAADEVEAELDRRRRTGVLRENPFRLLVAERRTRSLAVHEWDGRGLGRHRVADVHLEVSHGLHPREGWRRRRAAFVGACGEAAPDRERLLSFHASHPDGEGDAYSPCMHHSEASTVSLSFIEVEGDTLSFEYQPGRPCEARPRTRVELDLVAAS